MIKGCSRTYQKFLIYNIYYISIQQYNTKIFLVQLERLSEVKNYTRAIRGCSITTKATITAAAVNVRFRRVLVAVGKSAKKSQHKSKQGYFPKTIPPASGGSLWAGAVVTGESTPERKGEALSLIYSFLFFVIQPTLARYKCRK